MGGVQPPVPVGQVLDVAVDSDVEVGTGVVGVREGAQLGGDGTDVQVALGERRGGPAMEVRSRLVPGHQDR